MELKEFISESLSQILNGIEDAQKKLVHQDNLSAIYNVGQSRNDTFDQIEKIEFEVLVYTESNKSASGGANIKVFSIGIGGETEKESKQSQQNKIKFSVPVCFTKTTPRKK